MQMQKMSSADKFLLFGEPRARQNTKNRARYCCLEWDKRLQFYIGNAEYRSTNACNSSTILGEPMAMVLR